VDRSLFHQDFSLLRGIMHDIFASQKVCIASLTYYFYITSSKEYILQKTYIYTFLAALENIFSVLKDS
jgi:hypothetical protein